MGKDAYIYFKDTPSKELVLPVDYEHYPPGHEKNNCCYPGMHEIWCGSERLWTPEYPRGNWEALNQVLTQLVTDPGITEVLYGSDPGTGAGEPFTVEDLYRYRLSFEHGVKWAPTGFGALAKSRPLTEEEVARLEPAIALMGKIVKSTLAAQEASKSSELHFP